MASPSRDESRSDTFGLRTSSLPGPSVRKTSIACSRRCWRRSFETRPSRSRCLSADLRPLLHQSSSRWGVHPTLGLSRKFGLPSAASSRPRLTLSSPHRCRPHPFPSPHHSRMRGQRCASLASPDKMTPVLQDPTSRSKMLLTAPIYSGQTSVERDESLALRSLLGLLADQVRLV